MLPVHVTTRRGEAMLRQLQEMLQLVPEAAPMIGARRAAIYSEEDAGIGAALAAVPGDAAGPSMVRDAGQVRDCGRRAEAVLVARGVIPARLTLDPLPNPFCRAGRRGATYDGSFLSRGGMSTENLADTHVVHVPAGPHEGAADTEGGSVTARIHLHRSADGWCLVSVSRYRVRAAEPELLDLRVPPQAAEDIRRAAFAGISVMTPLPAADGGEAAA